MADNTNEPVDLMQELENLKRSLETAVTDTAKKEINAQMKRLEAQIELKDQAIEEINEWRVKKDEDDRKNQKALDKLCKAKDIEIAHATSFDNVLRRKMEEKSEDFERLKKRDLKNVVIEFGPEDTKAIMTIGSATTGLVSNISANNRGIIDRPNRKVHVRDVIPQGTMTGSSFPYMFESAAPIGAPAPTAEGELKPEVELRLTEALAPAEYIAGWTNMSTKLLDDVQGMSAFLNRRLIEALLRAEDNQLINGTGASPQLRGIGVAPNFTAATNLAAEPDVAQILGAFAQLENLDRFPTGIILNPTDYYRVIQNIETGAGYNLPTVVQVTPDGDVTIMGIKVVRTTAVPAGTYYIGDFEAGTLLLFREAPQIEFFYQDSDNVRRNAVTVRIEERVAFPVFGSNYIIKGTF